MLGVVLAIGARHRAIKRSNRINEVRATLNRFARAAHKNGHSEASGAYCNAAHIVGLMLERGVNIEPELHAPLTWVPDGVEVLPVTKDAP